MADPKKAKAKGIGKPKSAMRIMSPQTERKLKLLDEEIDILERSVRPNQGNFTRLFKIMRELIVELEASTRAF